MRNYKMCDNLKRARRRAKRSEIWESWILAMHICICGIFDLVVFKVILVSFGALVSKWPVSQKRLVLEQDRLKFGTRGY